MTAALDTLRQLGADWYGVTYGEGRADSYEKYAFDIALAKFDDLMQAVERLCIAEDGNSERPVAAIHDELLAVYLAYRRVLGDAA